MGRLTICLLVFGWDLLSWRFIWFDQYWVHCIRLVQVLGLALCSVCLPVRRLLARSDVVRLAGLLDD